MRMIDVYLNEMDIVGGNILYDDFAKLYDNLIKQDINYDSICDYIEEIFRRYKKTPSLICDLACGTGNITLPMSQRGYDMIGVDISDKMLSIAREKSQETHNDILYICQDLRKIDLFGTCDAFLCMTDGFNYITSLNSLKNIFKRIHNCFMNKGGLFIFDISSEYKLRNILGNNTYIYNTDDIFYSWENTYKPPVCKMELNFFIKEKIGYRHFEEMHIQRAYSINQIKQALIDSGFSSVDVLGGYSFESPSEDEQRLVFVAMQ